jgi:hypothetical protein
MKAQLLRGKKYSYWIKKNFKEKQTSVPRRNLDKQTSSLNHHRLKKMPDLFLKYS